MRKLGLTTKCGEHGIPIISEVWNPKSGFKGIVFAKFADTTTRDTFVSKVLSAKPEYEGDKVRSRAEASIETRVCENCLSGLKQILVGWGFDSSCIKWDTTGTGNTLKINDEIKVSVSVREGKFHCDWEQNWKHRVSFFPSPELQDLLTKVGEMVVGTGKRKGKGKCSFE